MHPHGTETFEKPNKNLIKKNDKWIKKKEKIEKTKSYFMQLNTKQKKNIYRMYKIDFEMFGYSPEPYHSDKIMQIIDVK